jgi:hypothetical protein
MSATLLWVIAVILVVVGIILLVQAQWILGIALILAALLVGPGGVSVFHSGRRAGSDEAGDRTWRRPGRTG